MTRPEIVAVRDPTEVAAVRALFVEYADALGIDLCFQGFEEELTGLPAPYAPPTGELFVAKWEDRSVGCVGVRNLGNAVCEMKRLYVRPEMRGSGLGRRLAEAAVDAGRSLGYSLMRLDTLASMTSAVRLYESLGFRRTTGYYRNPIPDAVYMERSL